MDILHQCLIISETYTLLLLRSLDLTLSKTGFICCCFVLFSILAGDSDDFKILSMWSIRHYQKKEIKCSWTLNNHFIISNSNFTSMGSSLQRFCLEFCLPTDSSDFYLIIDTRLNKEHEKTTDRYPQNILYKSS